MCGIAGYFKLSSGRLPEQIVLERMIHSVIYRGPDGFGLFRDGRVGLAHARLSIIDLEGGWQPIHNEDKSLWVIFNGEIFNYLELRRDLEKRGHRFYTNSDTEVIVHLYEEKQDKCLDDLNGQFAIALYDVRQQALFCARDRVGIRPFFYTLHNGLFYFASEIKSIFAASPSIPREINIEVLRDIFTCWQPVAAETIFKDIAQLEPGHWLRIDQHCDLTPHEYWDIPFAPLTPNVSSDEKEYSEQLRELLIDSVRLRLRADVSVGAYLSGGLDSSVITSLVHHYTSNRLKTFSVTFSDKVYDEKAEQNQMVEFLDTDHHDVRCSYEKISDAFPQVIWHAETPILRTAPTPLYLLSELVRRNRFKVVLTGEGADEILGGYDIFKEAKIRAFISRFPDSDLRSLLLKRLYPYLAMSPTKSADYARNFFDTDADSSDLFYGHRPRWKTTARTGVFFGDALKQIDDVSLEEKLVRRYGGKLQGLDFFSRAQYLEAKLLMANYLLSSQGDRMAMAHSVEGRFPFLDHRVIEFAATIPPQFRMKALNEKNILKKAMADILPPTIANRKKQPYMSPDILSFFSDTEPEYFDDYLSTRKVCEAGLFNEKAVARLMKKCRKKGRQGFMENMAFVGILSTQIVWSKFVRNFQVERLEKLDNLRVMT